MNVKLYVGNLSFSSTEDGLRTLFTQVGSVASVALIKDRDTGSSKGFAFVEMASQQDAEAAIKKLNGYSLDGREIKVNVARPREETSNRGGGYGSNRGGYGSNRGGYNSNRGGGYGSRRS